MKKIKSLLLFLLIFIIASCSAIENRSSLDSEVNIASSTSYTANDDTLGTRSNSDWRERLSPDELEIESQKPGMDTSTEDPIIWPPEKTGYSVNINNYDVAGDKAKYLLRVELRPGGDIHEYPKVSYFIDLKEIKNIEGFYEISESSIVPKVIQPYVLRVSEDGKKALLIYKYPTKEKDNIIEVFDIVNQKVIYQYKTQYRYLDKLCIKSSPNLEYLLLPTSGEYDYSVFVDVINNKELKIYTSPRDIISPDGKKTAVIITTNSKKVLQIRDLLTGELHDEIKLNAEEAYLTQWHPSGKILYYTIQGSFFYDINRKEIVPIGQYFYEPVMSPDGRYVAYYIDEEAGPFFPLYYGRHWLYKECGYNQGLYVKDLLTNELVQIAPIYASEYGAYNMIPLEWIYVGKNFDNEANRFCFPLESDISYVAMSSSNDGSYVIDGEIGTAWWEDFDYLPEDELEFSEYDGGIGEWIKIYKCRQVKIPEIDLTHFYFPTYYLEPMRLKGIKIINGYAKNKEIYKANNRVKKVEVILTDGTSYIFDLKDNTLDFQTLDFGETVETRDVTIKILDIYEGSKFNDTCISEIELITD